MYSGETILLDKDSTAPLKKEDKARMKEIVGWLKEWTKFLGMDKETRIYVRYVNDVDYKMAVHEDKADYFAYIMDVTKECLDPKRDDFREMDVIHEVLHMMLYHFYTRTAYTLAPGYAKRLLQKAEESLVSKLEIAIVRLCYGEDCTFPPDKPDGMDSTEKRKKSKTRIR
jgi:hypothetical protein